MSLPCPPPAKTELAFRNAEWPKEESPTAPTIYSDVVNVSEGFQLRTAYKKKVKASKLDGLLERRVRQFTLEEKQRLERMRHAKSAATKFPTICKAPEPPLATRQQQQQPLPPSFVKKEPKDEVVKRLDFEEEQNKVKKESSGDRAESPQLKEKQALQLNGRPPAKAEPDSENKPVVADVEKKESPGEKEGKKHGEEEQEADHGKPKLLQVNGGVEVVADPDQAGHVQMKNKDPVKSLVNGNLSQVDSPECQPPLSKVPRLENHVVVRDAKNEDVVKNDEPWSLPSSSTLGPSGNSTDSAGATTKVPQSIAPPQTASSILTSTTNQTSSMAVLPHKAEPLGPEAKAAPPGSMTISKEYSTRDKVSLLKFSKTKKARSGTALPSYRKFVTKSSKKSIFILPNDDLKRLARRGSIREVPIFNYSAKPALDIWPYPSPRPTFGITWRSI